MQVCDVKEKIKDQKIDKVRARCKAFSYELRARECDTIQH